MTFVLLLCLLVCVAALSPSLKITASTKALNLVGSLAIAPIVEKLKVATIPPFSGSDHTPIGHLDFTVDNFHFTSVAIHAIDVVPSTNHVLKLGVTGIDIGLKMDWKYRKTHWPHLHGHGSADVSVGGTSVSVSAQLMLGSSGAPEVKALGCNVAIGSFNLKVHGGASWLYNLLIKLFKHKIESAVQQGIEVAICSGIDKELNQLLASLPLYEPIGQGLGINYALVDPPFTQPFGLTFDTVGELVAENNKTLPKCTNAALPNEIDKTHMLQFIAGQCVFDSVGFAMYNADLLNIFVTDQDLPKNFSFNLTTNYFEFIIPALYQKYPNRKLEAQVYAPQPPVSTFSAKNEISVNSLVYFNISVLPTVTGDPSTPVFTMGTALQFDVSVALNGTNIVPKLTYVNGSTSLIWSYVVDPLITYSIQYALIPYANSYLAAGFPIPETPQVVLSNPVLTQHQDFVVVAADFVIRKLKYSDCKH